MKAILGRKLGMSQTFSPEGDVVPVTLIVAEKNFVAIRRTTDRDGYQAIQLALPKKPKVEQAEKNGTDEAKEIAYAAKMEFKGELAEDIKELSVAQFEPGDVVEVIGISKGKGFAGVVKRHHFKGGPASHGHRHALRRPGSIGSRFPQHVLKGKRMAGRMGSDRVTVKNLKVVLVDNDKQLLAIRGAVPGRKGSIIAVQML